jgi:hypothetical protein
MAVWSQQSPLRESLRCREHREEFVYALDNRNPKLSLTHSYQERRGSLPSTFNEGAGCDCCSRDMQTITYLFRF